MNLGPLVRFAARMLLLALAVSPLYASPAPQTAQPAAGKITALIPTGSVLHERKTLEAKKEMEVFWLDTVKTERGGRARVRLEDGSILNVGSQASLVVTKHDPGKQQTELDLAYGKVRADVTKISSPDGKFEIRTKVAVCGVVGTEEYLDATDLATTVIALGGGQVSVSASDPRFPGTTVLNPGEAISLIAGRPPGPKRLASSEELIKAVGDTGADPTATMDPGASVAGRSFDAVITGKGLNSTRGISFSQSGLTVKTRGEATSTQIPVTITVAPDVPVGAYQLTVDRPEGPAIVGFAVASQPAIQMAQASGGGMIQMPPSQNLSVTRGAKIPLDASNTRAPTGTQIVAYQWSVQNTPLAASGSTFTVNTSSLAPGNYTVQLTVVNDKGQVATQQYPLSVDAGLQPAEIVRDLASAYESLQPSAFLKNFDSERFHNYAGFAAAIEDSFRTKLESMRVFQRPVNCAVIEQQDQAICQAEFQLQFTEKNQPQELLDAQGNPIPPGTTPPPNATLGKRILTGSEQDTIRFERADAGWKIVDYAAVVSCPSGGSTTGINVGSCVLAIGSSITPSFQITNLQLFSTDLPLSGSVSGSFTVAPIGGFTGSISFTGQGQISNQSVSVQFTPNPANPGSVTDFTVNAPTTAPTGFNGPTPFTLVVTGRDATGAITATANATLVLQPDFSLNVQPVTSASAPAAVSQNSTLPLTVQIVSGTGFSGTVFIDFPNLPAGFSATAGNLTAGTQGSFPLTISAAASPGPALITVRGTLSSGVVKTSPFFVNVISDFTLSVTPATSQTNPAVSKAGGSVQASVQVVPISGFASTVAIDFPNLPSGFTATGGNVAAGATGQFTISNTVPLGLTVYQITIRGRFGTDVQTALFFVQASLPGPVAARGAVTPITVYAAEPAKLNPGDVVEGKLYGTNMNGVTAIQVSGSGIKAELLGSSPSMLSVRFTVDPAAEPGSRLISVIAGGSKATTAIDVTAANRPLSKPIPQVVAGAAENANAVQPSATATASNGSPAMPDLVVSPEDFTMTPLHPKPGDTVVFHLRVRNAGTARIEDAVIEFSIAGAKVRQREQVTLEPGVSESLDFEWKATGTGRVEPRVVIDPENRIRQLTRSGKTASLQSFELEEQRGIRSSGGASDSAARGAARQHGDLPLVVGGCAGFRLAAGAEVSCGGSADFEVHSRGDGTVLVIEAEGVRNMGAVPLDQAKTESSDALGTSESLVAGSTYLVQSRHTMAIVRVVQIRGIESVRNAPPAALRTPRISGSERAGPGGSEQSNLTLVLEWKVLTP